MINELKMSAYRGTSPSLHMKHTEPSFYFDVKLNPSFDQPKFGASQILS